MGPSQRRAIVVLGCRVRFDGGGRLAQGALRSRIAAAAAAYAQASENETIVIASGGRRWGAVLEADAMARELAAHGVPGGAILRERSSLSTRDNARFTAALLARHQIELAAVVTSDWHLERALALFRRAGRRAGVSVIGVSAPCDRAARWTTRLWRQSRERLLALMDRVKA